MNETSITHKEVERALRRAYPRFQTVLHVDRSPLRGGLSKAAREKMHVFAQNKTRGVEEFVLIAKEAPKSAHSIMSALYRRSALRGSIPEPLLYTRGTLLYRVLWGDEVRRLPFREEPKTLERIMREAGGVLAGIHNTPLPKGLASQIRTTAAREENVEILYRKFPKAMERFPLQVPISPKRRIGLVHGDFQASNLIVTLPEGKLGIIDFAAGGKGDQATDVASFLTHTELMLRGILAPKRVASLLGLFEKAYRKQVRSLGRDFDDALSAAKFDVLLSVLGTTVAHLWPDDPNYEPTAAHLQKLFNAL